MKTIKTIKILFVATVVISSVACKNESLVVEDSPFCKNPIAIAQANLDVANARFSELFEDRSSLEKEISDEGTLDQEQIDLIEEKISDVDQSIKAQGETIIEAKRALAESITACPSAQSALKTLDLSGANLKDVEIAKESETIDYLNSAIIEAYEEEQSLKAELKELQKIEIDDFGVPIDDIAVRVIEIDAEIESIKEKISNARKEYTMFYNILEGIVSTTTEQN